LRSQLTCKPIVLPGEIGPCLQRYRRQMISRGRDVSLAAIRGSVYDTGRFNAPTEPSIS